MRHIFGSVTLVLLVGCSSAQAPSGGGGDVGTGSGTGAATGGDDGGTPSGGSSGSSVAGAIGAAGSTDGGSSNPEEDAGSAGATGWGTGSGADSGASTGTGTGATGGTDAGTTSGPTPQAPTWTKIYGLYLATGTIGHCGGCHAAASTPSGAYGFLSSSSYINGTQSTLGAVFSWMGGFMPPGGPTANAQATADVDAWVAAGAPED